MGECVCVWERVRVRKRESESVCVRVRERERVFGAVQAPHAFSSRHLAGHHLSVRLFMCERE